jgi:hypothetical protein
VVADDWHREWPPQVARAVERLREAEAERRRTRRHARACLCGFALSALVCAPLQWLAGATGPALLMGGVGLAAAAGGLFLGARNA